MCLQGNTINPLQYLGADFEMVIGNLVDGVMLQVLKVLRLQEICIHSHQRNDWEAHEQEHLPPILRRL